jgi:predicted Zn-ribbon and HTH transcriptional regulator
MKDEDSIFIQRKEDPVALEIRRQEYALKRDQHAVENNQAIAKRLIIKEKNMIKCSRCGREFSAGIVSPENICPDCMRQDSRL